MDREEIGESVNQSHGDGEQEQVPEPKARSHTRSPGNIGRNPFSSSFFPFVARGRFSIVCSSYQMDEDEVFP